MIELKSISKRYGEQEVLRNVNYIFEKGKVYFVVGESGCGKTTLLNIIGKEDKDYEGIVLFNSEDIKEYTPKEQVDFKTTKVSYISQFPITFQELKVRTNLLIPKLVNKKTTENKGSFLNNIKENKKTKKLSVGEKQRVCIQRVINQNTAAILADEPTASLDEEYKTIVMEELVNIAKNKILIIVTHDIQLAEKYADEIIEIKNGRIKNKKNKHKIEAIETSKGSKNISFIDAFKFAKEIYKGERKRTSIYNYSLIIGIVLMTFTNSLSDGMMRYFQNQILSQNQTNYIEYEHSYKEINEEDLKIISDSVGEDNLSFSYYDEDVKTTIKIDEKGIELPNHGLINYEYNPNMIDGIINVTLNQKANSVLSTQLGIDKIGMDFVGYINEFYPDINFEYVKDNKIVSFSCLIGKIELNEDTYFSFSSSNKFLQKQLIEKFNIRKELKINDKVLEYLKVNEDYFIYQDKLYKHSKDVFDSSNLFKEKRIEYGNVDFDFNKVRVNNLGNHFKFLYSNETPSIGRKASSNNEIVLSMGLAEFSLFYEPFIGKSYFVEYEDKKVEFKVVGIVFEQEKILYYNQATYESLLDSFNSFKNYKNFPLKETLFLKENVDYNELLSWANKQNDNMTSIMIEVLEGMLPTMQGIKFIMRLFSIFSLLISITTLFVFNILDFESKQKEYKMLYRTGFSKLDIIKIFAFKFLLSNISIAFISYLMIVFMKEFINKFISTHLGINSLLSTINTNEILVYTGVFFFISIINFYLYLNVVAKRIK